MTTMIQETKIFQRWRTNSTSFSLNEVGRVSLWYFVIKFLFIITYGDVLFNYHKIFTLTTKNLKKIAMQINQIQYTCDIQILA